MRCPPTSIASRRSLPGTSMRLACAVAFLLAGCTSFQPRPDSFGADVPLGPDCSEIAGTYSNEADLPRYVQLTALLGLPPRLKHYDRHAATRVSIEIVDSRLFRLSALGADGSVIASRE